MPVFTIDTESFAETEVKKSRFLAFLVPIGRFEENLALLKAEHRKANHHVTAFRRMRDDGRVEEGARDDGEPGGTSGMPVLKTLIGADLVDAGIIVVRYFGGTKLGTGGLARAYSGAAALAIEAAAPRPWLKIVRKTVHGDFSGSPDLENRIRDLGLTVLDRAYSQTGVDILVEGAEALIGGLDDREEE